MRWNMKRDVPTLRSARRLIQAHGAGGAAQYAHIILRYQFLNLRQRYRGRVKFECHARLNAVLQITHEQPTQHITRLFTAAEWANKLPRRCAVAELT
jgi:hypothetical protein